MKIFRPRVIRKNRKDVYFLTLTNGRMHVPTSRKKKKTLTSTARRVLRTEIGVWSKNSPAPRRYIRSAFKVSAKKQTLFNCRHEDVVKAQKNFNKEKILQKSQMLEEKLRSAAMKRSYVLFRKGIRAKCGVQQSPEKALERLQHLHRVERVQRLWRVYTESRSSTEALGKSISEKLSFDIAQKSSNYDEFVSLLQDAKVLDGMRLWLKRLDSRLDALGAEQSIATRSHLRLLFPATKKIACHHQCRNPRIDSCGDFVIPRFPTRILMCAYMVCAHPEMVTGEYATEDDEPYEVREL